MDVALIQIFFSIHQVSQRQVPRRLEAIKFLALVELVFLIQEVVILFIKIAFRPRHLARFQIFELVQQTLIQLEVAHFGKKLPQIVV